MLKKLKTMWNGGEIPRAELNNNNNLHMPPKSIAVP